MTEYFNSESAIIGTPEDNLHDVIIQGLDQSIEYSGQMVEYPVEPFQASQSAWDGVPAVYIPNGVHIPPSAFNKDPVAALKAYGGSVVGAFENSQVHISGKPRLQSQARITDDSVEQKIKEGKIWLSSAFSAPGTSKIEYPITPSYVMLSDRDARAQPRDKTSMFLNSEPSEEPDMSDEVKISELKRDLHDEKETVERLNSEAKDSTAHAVELTGTIERLNSEGEAKDTTITELKGQLSEFMNAKEESDWNSIKATLPPGLVAKPEDEKALRELMNSDVHAYTIKIMSVARPAETEKEGTEFLNSEGSSDDKLKAMGITLF